MQIKIKAWQKLHKKMVDVTEMRFDGSGKIKSISTYRENQCPRSITYSDINEDFRLERDGESCLELLRYTNIKDKNDREIYDGDTIKFTERTINGRTFTHVCQVFQSENGAWRVEGYPDFKTEHKTRRELYSVRHFCEVIGNKYENPELLKEEK